MPLVRAQAERGPERLLTLLALLSALVGVAAATSAALFAWVADLGAVPNAVLLLTALLPFIVGLVLRSKARAGARRIEKSLAQAWSSTVADVYRAHGSSLTARELGSIVMVDEEEAERLLAEAHVEAMLSGAPEPALRIEPEPQAEADVNPASSARINRLR